MNCLRLFSSHQLIIIRRTILVVSSVSDGAREALLDELLSDVAR